MKKLLASAALAIASAVSPVVSHAASCDDAAAPAHVTPVTPVAFHGERRLNGDPARRSEDFRRADEARRAEEFRRAEQARRTDAMHRLARHQRAELVRNAHSIGAHRR